jgi:hypothetical protein
MSCGKCRRTPAADGPRWLIQRRRTLKNEVLHERELSTDELSLEELDAVSGGFTLADFGFGKVTTGDVADAAKWVWNKLF